MTIKDVKNNIAKSMNNWYSMAYFNLYEYSNEDIPLSLLEKTPLFNVIFEDSKKYGLDKSLENHRADMIRWSKNAVENHTYYVIPQEESIPIGWLESKRNSPEYKYLPEVKKAIDLVLDCWEKDKQRENSEFVVETPPLEEKETEERDL